MPLLRAIEFAERAQRSQGIVDFGFQAARRLQFCHLSAQLRTVIGCSPTLFTALQQVCKLATLEDNVLSMWLEQTDDHVKICSKLINTPGAAHLEHSQWMQNIFSVHIVRQFAGQEWEPVTMAFEARYSARRPGRAGPTRDFSPGNTPRGSKCRSH